MTPKNAPMQARKSNLSTFQSFTTASKSISPRTAFIIIAARTAFGVYSKRGVINSKVRSTTNDIIILETAVWQPVMKFTADLEKDPGKERDEFSIKSGSESNSRSIPRMEMCLLTRSNVT